MADLIETISEVDLSRGCDGLEGETMLDSPAVQRRRLRDENLQKSVVYPANLFLARVRGGKLQYGIGGRETFYAIAGVDIDKFTEAVMNPQSHGLLRLDKEQLKEIVDLEYDIVWRDVDRLGLIEASEEYSKLLLDTSDLNGEKLKSYQRPIVAKIHGSMKDKHYPNQNLSDYGRIMEMIGNEGKDQSILRFPNPAYYLRDNLKEGEVVAGSCYIYSVSSDSTTYLGSPYVGIRGSVCGIKK